MNLAELNKQLYNVVEFLSENNRRHSSINENLLPAQKIEETSGEPKVAEQGLLPEYRDLISRLNRIAEEQANNVNRTQDFILCKISEEGTTVKGY